MFHLICPGLVAAEAPDAAPAPGGRGRGANADAGGAGPGSAASGGLAVFSKSGDVVIGGQMRGALTVVDTATRRILDIVRVGGSGVAARWKRSGVGPGMPDAMAVAACLGTAPRKASQAQPQPACVTAPAHHALPCFNIHRGCSYIALVLPLFMPCPAGCLQLPNSARVTDLVLNRKGDLLLATCQDQRVRMFELAPAVAGRQGAAVAAAGAPGAGGSSNGDGGGAGSAPMPAPAVQPLEPPTDAQLAEAVGNKVGALAGGKAPRTGSAGPTEASAQFAPRTTHVLGIP